MILNSQLRPCDSACSVYGDFLNRGKWLKLLPKNDYDVFRNWLAVNVEPHTGQGVFTVPEIWTSPPGLTSCSFVFLVLFCACNSNFCIVISVLFVSVLLISSILSCLFIPTDWQIIFSLTFNFWYTGFGRGLWIWTLHVCVSVRSPKLWAENSYFIEGGVFYSNICFKYRTIFLTKNN